MLAARPLLTLTLGCLLALSVAIDAPATDPQAANDLPAIQLAAALGAAPVPAAEICRVVTPTLPAASLSCNPPPGCPTPEAYCHCRASGYPEWVCFQYGC